MIGVADIAEIAAGVFETTVEEMRAPTKLSGPTLARQVAMKVAYDFLPDTNREVAFYFGRTKWQTPYSRTVVEDQAAIYGHLALRVMAVIEEVAFTIRAERHAEYLRRIPPSFKTIETLEAGSSRRK